MLTLLDREPPHLTVLIIASLQGCCTAATMVLHGRTTQPPQGLEVSSVATSSLDLLQCSPVLPHKHPSSLPKSYWFASASNENKQENVDKQHLNVLIATFTVSR